MSRNLRLAFMVLTLALLPAAVLVAVPRSAISRKNAARLHVGMTRHEAELILGGPARDESTGAEVIDAGAVDQEELDAFCNHSGGVESEDSVKGGGIWRSGTVMVVLYWDRTDRLCRCDSIPLCPARWSVISVIRQYLRM